MFENSQFQHLELDLKLNYHEVAIEIIRLLRNEMSQRELSEKLGYSFNQVGKWESGVTQIKLSDFLVIANTLEFQTEKHFREAFYYREPEFSVPIMIKRLETVFALNLIPDKGFQKSLAKWKQGAAEPDFAEFLQLLGSQAPVLFGYLSRFVDCSKISLLQNAYKEFLVSVDVVLADPRTCFILPALRVSAYLELEAHDDAVLAEHAACTIAEVRSGLQLLETHGIVRFENNKYHTNCFDLSFPNFASPKLRHYQKHTLQLAADLYPVVPRQSPPVKTYNPAMGSVYTVALSKEAARKVSDAIAHFHITLGEIVKQDQNPKTAVQIIFTQSFPANFGK